MREAPRGLISKLLQRDDWDGKRRYRWQKRPLTPEEEKQQRLEEARKKLEEEQRLAAEAEKRKKDAYNKLRIAVDFIDKEFNSEKVHKAPEPGVAQLMVLSEASEYLNQARGLDPSASIQRQLDKGTPPILFSIDDLAAEILYKEADMHYRQAEAQKQMAIGIIRRFEQEAHSAIGGHGDLKSVYRSQERTLAQNDEMVRENLRKSRDALEKCLKYRPKSISALQRYADILISLGNPQRAKMMAEQALALDPNDIESIKLIDRLKK